MIPAEFKVQQWFYWRFRVMTTTGTTTTTVTGGTQKCRQEQKKSVWMEKEENKVEQKLM